VINIMKQTLLEAVEILVGYDPLSGLCPYIPSMIIWSAHGSMRFADAPACLSPFSMSAGTVAVFFGSPALIPRGMENDKVNVTVKKKRFRFLSATWGRKR